MNPFESLGLSPAVVTACDDFGYTEPTPVQERAIPLVLKGRDIIAAAKTGTGKTAAFALPAMDLLPRATTNQKPMMLVVTPTRELARQIGEVCEGIAKHTAHRVLTVVGGVSYDPQISKLQHGVDILIATPGRLVDLMDRQAVNLSSVQTLVLDEADRMLDMGFWPSMRKIIGATPTSRQTLLFSATIDRAIMSTAGALMRDPAMVEIAHKGETADQVDQYLIHVQQAVKPALLRALLSERGSQRVIVFCRTRGRADATCRRLKRAGISAEAIHSSRTQNQRQRALDNFAAGRTDVIVATDVLARGIDVEDVSYVVNYDLPMQAEDYIHRIGRTGRAGAHGFAVSFVNPESADLLKDIEKLLKRSLPELQLRDFDMKAANEEAQAKAANADARRDPEIQQAKKELAAKRRTKEKARQKAANETAPKAAERAKRAHQAKQTKPKRLRDPKRQEQGSGKTPEGRKSARNDERKPSRSSQKAGRKTPRTPHDAKRVSSEAPQKTGRQGTRPSGKPVKSPSGSDCRPGRAQRAARKRPQR